MRLLDAILERGERFIRVGGTVSERWPTAEGGTVHAVMLVEFVAQGTALLGTQLMRDNEGKLALLVGLPEAVLNVRRIRYGTRLIADVHVARGSGEYLVCDGVVRDGTDCLATVTLQGIRVPAKGVLAGSGGK
ncbi:MAG: hypothetical protein JW751_04570 [Polyangiaceae bacterium]|nr:hypothetical protein [Polyangiaceae bacterium]